MTTSKTPARTPASKTPAAKGPAVKAPAAKAPATKAPAAKAPALRKFSPLADRVIVKPDEAKEEMRGGIVIPDTAKEKPQEGEIIAAGPGRMTDDGKRIAMTLKVGDRVIYSKYGGSPIKDQGLEFLILRESDILAKIAGA